LLRFSTLKQILASHQLYLKTEYHEGDRAKFLAINLTGRDFAGLGLLRIKIDRALV